MEKTKAEKNRNDDEHNWCRYNPIPLLSLVVSEPYYLFHFIAFFAYMVKEESWEGFIADTLFFAKIFLVAVALVMDYHLALWFMAIFFVIYILTGQPAYKGLGTSVQLTPLQLETLLTEGNNGSRFWLVASFCAINKLATLDWPDKFLGQFCIAKATYLKLLRVSRGQ
ncbi:hypothetical protein RJ640_006390 [Escallonia rubra]|uniref:Uncharacterized protein n=1 Tax=Escallonia rubra TaxID=112253 RepID=A0AA88UNB2_9ASTE|nr:hypothetical protein RJ640_006390 [Escallonia rubra]